MMPGADQRRGARTLASAAPTMPPIRACEELDGNAVIPGDDVPGDGAAQRAEDQMRLIDDARIDDALADGGRDAQVEDEDRDEVEERRNSTACPGLSTPVDTTVAMEFAAS